MDSTSAFHQINFLVVVHGRIQDLPRGGGATFLGGLGELHAAKQLETRGVTKCLLGGFGGMLPRQNFFDWCNLVRIFIIFLL